jgi:hypothetical protein
MAEAVRLPSEHRRWTKREEMILVAYRVTYGNNWIRYEPLLPGRNRKQIGAHWHEMVQKEMTGKITKSKPGENLVATFDTQKYFEDQEDEFVRTLRELYG